MSNQRFKGKRTYMTSNIFELFNQLPQCQKLEFFHIKEGLKSLMIEPYQVEKIIDECFHDATNKLETNRNESNFKYSIETTRDLMKDL